jgi:hypothetical protein
MTSRFVLIIAAAAGFLVTLMLSAWHEGLRERPAKPPGAVTQTAPAAVLAPQPPLKVASPPVRAAAADPVPPPAVPAVAGDSPAVNADSDIPPTSERELAEQRRERARAARSR